MSWNGSTQVSAGKSPANKSPVGGGAIRQPKSKALSHGLIAGLIIVALGGAAVWWFVGRDSVSNHTKPLSPSRNVQANRTITANDDSKATLKDKSRDNERVKAAKIAHEYNEQVKDLIKAKTNDIVWIQKPLAPDDPDNALRTRVTQELGSLLSVEPGEAMPPFPYSFLLEDDMKAAAERGEDVGEIDNGNAAFLDSLKKFKIVAKETDDDKRIEHKSKLIEAQSELLAGIDQGLSVNDSIRAAYEFRKRAYETRSAAIETMSEFIQKGDDIEDTKSVLKQINKQFADQGIKAISEEEIGIEPPEETEGGNTP